MRIDDQPADHGAVGFTPMPQRPQEDRLEAFLDQTIDFVVGLAGMAIMFGAIWFVLWVWS